MYPPMTFLVLSDKIGFLKFENLIDSTVISYHVPLKIATMFSESQIIDAKKLALTHKAKVLRVKCEFEAVE